VIGTPPLSIGGFQEIANAPFNGFTITPTGMLGADLGVLATATDAFEVPASFTANTVTDCEMPLVRPVIVQVVFETPEVEPST